MRRTPRTSGKTNGSRTKMKKSSSTSCRENRCRGVTSTTCCTIPRWSTSWRIRRGSSISLRSTTLRMAKLTCLKKFSLEREMLPSRVVGCRHYLRTEPDGQPEWSRQVSIKHSGSQALSSPSAFCSTCWLTKSKDSDKNESRLFMHRKLKKLVSKDKGWDSQ